jgi:kynureninase
MDSIELAQKYDSEDALSSFRDEFFIPPYTPAPNTNGINNTGQMVYLCGNSLGLQPKLTKKNMLEELEKWELEGVEGHFKGERPWATIDEKSTKLAVDIVGAIGSHEIAIMNSLSVNLHVILLSFYQPNGKRTKIIMESGAFCSDNHIIRSQIVYHGLDLEKDLVLLTPRPGHSHLLTEDILAEIDKHGDTVALVLLPGIQFYTGQLFQMEKIAKKSHEIGAVVGFDLAHAVGNVPLELHNWDVDFAAWCNYKYCNSGPGAVGGAFIHEKFFIQENQNGDNNGDKNDDNNDDNNDDKNTNNKFYIPQLPKKITTHRLNGWWGQKLSDRFGMQAEHVPILGAQAWQMSNPPVTSVICVESSYELFAKIGGVKALREKSLKLTKYLESLLNHHIIGKENKARTNITIITPTDPEQRGAQLSLEFSTPIVSKIAQKLIQNGVICDERKPKVIRISPAPFYNTFSDVYRAVMTLKMVLNEDDVISP